jgi:hypothetical protein
MQFRAGPLSFPLLLILYLLNVEFFVGLDNMEDTVDVD